MAHLYPTNLGMTPEPAMSPPEIYGLGRDDVRLMTIDRKTGATGHHSFQDIAQFFEPGDLLVVNNSATIPAALLASIEDKAHQVHLAARQSARQVIIELRQSDGTPDERPLDAETPVHILNASGHVLSQGLVLEKFHPRSRFWTVCTDHDWYELATREGLPIRYHYVDRPYPINYYQTVFGKIPGSSEMPSASRPFTTDIVDQLKEKGVEIVELTLHTTVSSHEVNDDDPNPPLVPEWYDISPTTQSAILLAQRENRSIIALGTTVVRAIETWAQTRRSQGWTTHLVTPHSQPKVTSGLVTGMHDSFTSHLWLIYAFVPADTLIAAYRQAQAHGYRWHEFGDLTYIR